MFFLYDFRVFFPHRNLLIWPQYGNIIPMLLGQPPMKWTKEQYGKVSLSTNNMRDRIIQKYGDAIVRAHKRVKEFSQTT